MFIRYAQGVGNVGIVQENLENLNMDTRNEYDMVKILKGVVDEMCVCLYGIQSRKV